MVAVFIADVPRTAIKDSGIGLEIVGLIVTIIDQPVLLARTLGEMLVTSAIIIPENEVFV